MNNFLTNYWEKKIGIKFRLPRSAEWEYAAKEGYNSVINQELTRIFESDLPTEEKWREAALLLETHRYPRFSGECETVTKADLGIKGHSDLYEVAFYEPNSLGLYDMSGCVAEWCQDIDMDDYFDTMLESDTYKALGYDENPTGPNMPSGDRVWRGGGWDCDESDCTTTYFFSAAQRDIESNLGFRLVLDEAEYQKFMNLLG